MGKGHRDNYRARKKRGDTAFSKRAMRRAFDTHKIKCTVCGNEVRIKTLVHDMCQRCARRLGLMPQEE